MRRLLVAALGVFVLAALALVVNRVLPLPGGPLSEGGNSYGSPGRSGKPLTAAAFTLDSDSGRRLVIEEVELPEIEGLDYLGVVVRRSPDEVPRFGVGEGYPPADPALAVERVRPAEGFELAPHDFEPLLIGFVGAPGDFVVTNVEVVYRMKLLGRLGVRFRQKLNTRLGVCLRAGPARPSCDPPDPAD